MEIAKPIRGFAACLLSQEAQERLEEKKKISAGKYEAMLQRDWLGVRSGDYVISDEFYKPVVPGSGIFVVNPKKEGMLWRDPP